MSTIEPRTRTGERVVEMRATARNRLIESRLTPNAISMTGLVLNVVAAVLVLEEEFFLGGLAFIIGSIMDTLDGRYSRMSGKGTPFGAFLDSTLDRIEEGVVLTAVAVFFAREGNETAVAAVVLTVLLSLMVSYTRARAEALGRRVQGGPGDACGPRRDPVRRPRVREGRRTGRFRTSGAGHLRYDGAHRFHGAAAGIPCPQRSALGTGVTKPRHSSTFRAPAQAAWAVSF